MRKNLYSLDIVIDDYHREEIKNFNFYKKKEIEKIHSLIKENLYNKNNYKWNSKKAYYFVSRNRLNPDIFIDFLKDFFLYYYSINSKGKTGAFKFLAKLEGVEKYKFSLYNFGGFELNEKSDVLEFLQEIKTLKKNHLKVSHNRFVGFINKYFKTGLSPTTLRRYYYDEQK